MKSAQSVAEAVVRTRSSLSSWSCMSARRRSVGPSPNSKKESLGEASVISESTTESLLAEEAATEPISSNDEHNFSNGGLDHDDTDEEEQLIRANQDITASTVDDITEGQLWYELEKELQNQDTTLKFHAQEEEAAAAKEITEEEIQLADAAKGSNPITTSSAPSSHCFAAANARYSHLFWEFITPFGLAVVPEVKVIACTSFGSILSC